MNTKTWGVAALVCLTMSVQSCSDDTPAYKNPNNPVEVRVADLLKRMTLEEKVAQMQDLFFKDFSVEGKVDVAKMDSVLKGMSYASVFGSKLSVEQMEESMYAINKYMAEHNRLGIPVLGEAESLHGLIHDGATIFPQAIALSSTFNPDITHRVATVIAQETKATGVDQVLSPVLDLARELRWGRVEETYGEDPYLAGRMGVAYVSAFNKEGVMTTLKHFLAHGSPNGGLNLASVAGCERDLRSLYLKPFQAVMREAMPYSVMNSYNSYESIPVAASRWILDDILRGEMGFKGYITSDWGSVDMLRSFHRTAQDKAEAARQAVLAGVDVEVDGDCYEKLDSLVRAGVLPESEIDKCVSRVLTAKFAMGLFDKDYTKRADLSKTVHTPEAVELALEAARESAILVKNEKNLLPLDVNQLRSVAVIGPNAAQVQFGDYMWTNSNEFGVTPLQGIEAITQGKVKINYAKGCEIHTQDRSGFAQAVASARNSDVALLFVGAMSGSPGRPWPNSVSGESFDLSDISLQEELIRAVKATGKPTVVVLVAGKPFAMPWVKDNCEAVIVQWYGGEQEGRAIAEILFGEVNPSGRLNVSFPQSTGHLPVYYNYYPSDKGFYHDPGSPEKPGRDFVFSSPDPVWAFGHGLSYTTFEYKSMQVSGKEFTADGICEITVEVANTGKRDGKEVVQLYVNDVVSSVVTPIKELRRFEKVFIPVGETRKVTFSLPMKELALWNSDMKEVVEPGDFELQVGAASDDIRLTEIITVK
jgi:beta-glucosidase